MVSALLIVFGLVGAVGMGLLVDWIDSRIEATYREAAKRGLLR